MAKLKAHGAELLRLEFATYRVAIFEDGKILRNEGRGWKLFRQVKPGVDIHAYVMKRKELAQRKADLCPNWTRFVDLLVDAASLSSRLLLYTVVEMMPDDPDGVWSHANDDLGMSLTVDDCVALCEAYRLGLPELQGWKKLREMEQRR